MLCLGAEGLATELFDCLTKYHRDFLYNRSQTNVFHFKTISFHY